ncbi:leucyl aminopeptidase [Collybia nuda]|uniref:Aminopeptidase n=1 Tax=Collybia nuda TaxID=64659 RepID=A0A9P5Y843_9AGAR|nr:leucyl aminopeptidase [Collybia nuda]
MTPNPVSTTGTSNEYRLPINTKPTHYDLIIRTDLEKLQFEGFVKISLNVNKETSSICFHTAALLLGKAVVYSDALKTEQVQSGQSLDVALERVTYHFPQALPGGSKAELRMGFSGGITKSMTGYYRSSFQDGDGKTKYYALTHFEPTAARHAFPCWDEPSLRATFSVTMVSREGTVNLSNMPPISEGVFNPFGSENTDLKEVFPSLDVRDGDGWKITRFQTTPPMSTYIVAFANGDFKYLERFVAMPLSGKNVPLRIYGTADVIHQAQFALDVKAAVLPLYEKIFDVEYPLPKLDTLVAHDFDGGAMENWGLITGRTSIFLVDPKSAGLHTKKIVASVQSHEVAHMWFGNITTMEWWDYLYLNEGFATLMGEVIIAGNTVFPEWKVNSEFITDHLNRALSLDAKLSSHPIEVACPDANHINQIFDDLSYSKAASVLRMLSNYVGEELFLKGVSLYLKKNLYANTVTNDLWEGITLATGVDIVQLMDSWISKIGFPVLTVTETSNGIRVHQDRFLETGRAEPKENETIWNVPLSILTVDRDGNAVVDRSAVLRKREQIYGLDTSKPYKLNAGTVGVYRVLYTPEHLVKISAEISKPDGISIFSLDDRIGLVHDVMALSKAGLANLSSALTLVEGLKGETEYLVWSGIADNLSDLVSVWWEDPQLLDSLNAFRKALFVPLVNKLGYEYSDTEPTDTSLLRTCAVEQAALARDAGVTQELKDRFAHLAKTGDDSKIPVDLQRVVFSVGVRLGGKEEYDAVVKVQEKPKTPSSKNAAMHAMCATEDPELLKQTLDFIIHKSRDQDLIYFFLGLSSNLKTRRLLFQFFKDNYDAFYNRFEENFTFRFLVEMSTKRLSTDKDYSNIIEFFKNKDTSKYDQALAQVLDSIRARIAFIEVLFSVKF